MPQLTRPASVHLLLLVSCCFLATAAAAERPKIRVAVIGGQMLDLWKELAAQFETDTGWKTELAVTGSKTAIAEPFHRGTVDLLTIHTSDEATALLADDSGVNPRPWARNEQVIVGPPADPAGIRGMKDGAAALQKIAAAQAPFFDFYSPGSRELARKLWERAGLKPEGSWVLKDDRVSPAGIVAFAESKQAYVIVGKIPAPATKLVLGKMEVFVQDDPGMHRDFLVIEANPKKFPQTNSAGARALADWLVGEPGQRFLAQYGSKAAGGIPLYLPVTPPAEGR